MRVVTLEGGEWPVPRDATASPIAVAAEPARTASSVEADALRRYRALMGVDQRLVLLQCCQNVKRSRLAAPLTTSSEQPLSNCSSISSSLVRQLQLTRWRSRGEGDGRFRKRLRSTILLLSRLDRIDLFTWILTTHSEMSMILAANELLSEPPLRTRKGASRWQEALPSDVWLQVLQMLSLDTVVNSVQRVCRRLHHLCSYRYVSSTSVTALTVSESTLLYVSRMRCLVTVSLHINSVERLRLWHLLHSALLQLPSLASISLSVDLSQERSQDTYSIVAALLSFVDSWGCLLRSLSLSHLSSLNDKDMSCLLEATSQLRHLQLAETPLLSNATVLALPRIEMSLQSLKLQSTMLSDPDHLVDILPQLGRLNALARTHSTTVDLRFCSAVPPSIIDLDMSGCPLVDDDCLQMLTGKLPHLTSLRISRCCRITDHGLVTLLSDPFSSGIRRLDVSFCYQLTDRCFDVIAKRLCRLGHLDVSGCIQTSDHGVQMLVQSAHTLYFLSLRFCSSLTDTGISLLAVHLPHLHTIDVSGCIHLSINAFDAFTKCRSLSSIKANSCPLVSLTCRGSRVFRELTSHGILLELDQDTRLEY